MLHAGPELHDLCELVLALREDNLAKLQSCRVAWSLKTIDNGFTLPERKSPIESSSEHIYWKEREREAASVSLNDWEGGSSEVTEAGRLPYKEWISWYGDELHRVMIKDNVSIASPWMSEYSLLEIHPISQSTAGKTYPEEFQFKNPSDIIESILSGDFEKRGIEVDFAIDDTAGEKILKIICSPGDGAHVDEEFSLDKGGVSIRHSIYRSDNTLQSRIDYSISEVSENLWLPTRLTSTVKSNDGLDDLLLKEYAVDLNDSVFNRSGELDGRAFVIQPKADTVVFDFRSGQKVITDPSNKLPTLIAEDNAKLKLHERELAKDKLSSEDNQTITTFMITVNIVVIVLVIFIMSSRRRKSL